MKNNVLINMVGQKYGRWTVLERGDNTSRGQAQWICRCECGTVRQVNGENLRNGVTKSCGCLNREKTASRNLKHGGAKRTQHDRLYRVWRGMIGRCYSPKNISYKWYGAIGVSVCDEWKEDYAKFREWAESNGYDPMKERGDCTIDRIDPCGNYEPSNCRWVDCKVQSVNKRRKYEEITI